MKPEVYVLMSTWNGEKYIEEQINSILNQEGVDVILWIRDDGSTDSTKQILSRYEQNYPNIKVFYGSNLGYINSFMELAVKKGKHSQAYTAFSDQDDIWLPDKLISAVRLIEQEPDHNEIPVLYYSDLNVVNEQGEFLKKANTWEGTINRYMFSVFIGIRGCTMVMNPVLTRLVERYTSSKIFGHDTFIAELAFWSGKVVYDAVPHINYRQTGGNLSQTNITKKDKIFKNLQFIKKRCTVKSRLHETNARELLAQYNDVLNDPDELEIVANYRSSLGNRIRLLRHGEFFQFSLPIRITNVFLILAGKL